MPEKTIVNIEGKFNFTIGNVPNDDGRYIICIHSSILDVMYFDMAEWFDGAWEDTSNACRPYELSESEEIVGYAPCTEPIVTYAQ